MDIGTVLNKTVMSPSLKLIWQPRKFHMDPADASNPTAGQDRPPSLAQHFTGLQMRSGISRHKSEQATAMDTALPPDTRAVVEVMKRNYSQ